MKDVQKVVDTTVQGMIDSGEIEETIKKGVEKAINQAIDDQFRPFGSISQKIDQSLKEGLQINLGDLPFEVYNQQMLVLIKSKLGNMFQGQAAEKFLAEMDRILAPVPKEMAIKDFVQQVVKGWRTEDFCDDSVDEYATVELVPDEHRIKDAYSLKMWKQRESGYLSRSKNPPDLHLFILNDQIRINHGQRYNPTSFREHEALVFKLYAAGTVLTGLDDFDPDSDCDLALRPEFD